MAVKGLFTSGISWLKNVNFMFLFDDLIVEFIY